MTWTIDGSCGDHECLFYIWSHSEERTRLAITTDTEPLDDQGYQSYYFTVDLLGPSKITDLDISVYEVVNREPTEDRLGIEWFADEAMISFTSQTNIVCLEILGTWTPAIRGRLGDSVELAPGYRQLYEVMGSLCSECSDCADRADRAE